MLSGRSMQPLWPMRPRVASAAPLLQRARAPLRMPALLVQGSAGGHQGQGEGRGAAQQKGFGEPRAGAKPKGGAKPADAPRAKPRGFGKPDGMAKAAAQTDEELEAKALLQMLALIKSDALQHGDITFQGRSKETFAVAFVWCVSGQLGASKVEHAETMQAIRLIDKLLDKTQLQISRWYTGGSCGRGTLVAGCFDVDLIVCVRGIKGQRATYEDWRKDPSVGREARRMAKEALQKKAKARGIQISDHEQYRYAMRVAVGRVKVDLLLLPEVVPDELLLKVPVSPKLGDPRRRDAEWAGHDLLMGRVYRDPGSARYSVMRERADSGALTVVVRAQPLEMRAVARTVKAWRNSLEEGLVPDCGIGSSTLEVLVLAAHQRLVAQGREPSGNVFVVDLLIASLRLLVAAVEKREVVTVNAGEWGPGCGREELVERYGHCWEQDPVRIIHPVDPTCNMARPRNRADKPEPKWEAVAAEAKWLAGKLETGTLLEVLRAFLPAVEISHEGVAAAQRRALGLPPPSQGDSVQLTPLVVLRALIEALAELA